MVVVRFRAPRDPLDRGTAQKNLGLGRPNENAISVNALDDLDSPLEASGFRALRFQRKQSLADFDRSKRSAQVEIDSIPKLDAVPLSPIRCQLPQRSEIAFRQDQRTTF